MLKTADLQMDFHRLLRDYVNGGCFSAGDRLQSFFSSRKVFSKNANNVCAAFREHDCISASEKKELILGDFEGRDSRLLALRDFLQPVRQHIKAVIVHGSQADGHTTGYSDVDALVVLRDSLFDDPALLEKTARRLSRARAFMYRIDPLQHHGWFVMSEKDLSCFSEKVLPASVLEEARVLMGDPQLVLPKTQPQTDHFRQEAIRVLNRLSALISDGWRPRNAYALKSFLSECMMLPVVYLQARDRCGWSKRESFRAAENDFPQELWHVVTELSVLRSNWSYHPNPLSAAVLHSAAPWSDKLRKYWPSAVPRAIGNQVDEDFYRNMHSLIVEMRQRIESSGR